MRTSAHLAKEGIEGRGRRLPRIPCVAHVLTSDGSLVLAGHQ